LVKVTTSSAMPVSALARAVLAGAVVAVSPTIAVNQLCTTPGRSCAGRESHWICVITSTQTFTTDCWDACDYVNHPASKNWTAAIVPVLPIGATLAQFKARTNAIDQNSILQLTVKEIQSGKNLAISCPKGAYDQAPPQSGTDWCPLGTFCGGKQSASSGYGTTGGTKHAQSIPDDRGICVTDPNGPFSRRCEDMCDYSLSPTDYNKKGMVDVSAKVSGARDSGICPTWKLWPWLLGIVVLVACCALGFQCFMKNKGRMKHRALSSQASSQKFDPVHDVPQAMPDPVMEEPQMMAPELNPYDQGPPLDHGPPPAAMEQQLLGPADMQPQGLSRPESNSNYMGGGGIAGLTAPQLHMPSVQPMSMPQTYATAATPLQQQQAQPLPGSFFPQSLSRPPVQGGGLYSGQAYMTNPMMPQAVSQGAVPLGVSQQVMPQFATQMPQGGSMGYYR
jgi:hypothetical protein